MSARSAGWVPQQHGAWAMLASPLLLGALASGLAWIHLPLTAFWFAGYFLFYASSMWLKSGRKARYLPATRAYAVLAAVLGVAVAVAQPGLLRWVPWFLVPLGVGLWAAAHRQERALLAGLTTVLASALMTVVAYDAGPGEDLRRAAVLALGQFLYFGGTVWYVKSMIRERGNLGFRGLSVGWHALSTLAVAAFCLPLAAVFAVLTLRAWIVPRFSFSPKQIGVAEIGSTVAVALMSLVTVS
ncbi:MAG: YwiC-like family protein [Actinomycetales bacterium]|nr:YwiC-like family protein [Actinomycetales bacterium]